MRKTVLGSLVLVTSLFFVGCGKKVSPESECNIGGANTPNWICAPSIEGGIAEIGVAKKNAGSDYGFQVEEAMANGRTSIARRIEVSVQSMMKNWKRTTGEGDSQTFEKNVESVSKQVAQQTLKGSRQFKAWRSSDGTLYLLVGIDNKDVIKGEVKNSVKTSFKNDEALWQQFQSQKAMEELDMELSKKR